MVPIMNLSEDVQISLRPATTDDRLAIFRALTRSNLTDILLGYPSLNYTPILSFEEFYDDYADHF